MDIILDMIRRHRQGERIGIYSICSAHPMVIAAGFHQALFDGSCALIEATSNQVDQFGGYTGMTPSQFRDFVYAIAKQVGFPRERIVLGGDHLGPNRWQHLDAETAMAHAETLVASYVAAGFSKIHLDCSMTCVGDLAPITDAVVAERAARLAAVAERTARECALASSPVYIIGTEVPVPGGAHETIDTLKATDSQAARTTIASHQRAFRALGLDQAWSRVVGLVVQPGVEFDHFQVIDYQRESARALSRVVEAYPHLVFEAHSTDYQTPTALAALVEDHFAILKVGPGLTFALREALFGLALVEDALVPPANRSCFRQVVEQAMLEQPQSWERYYSGDAYEQHLARQYSFSDRIRYYWPDDAVQAAQKVLFDNLADQSLPLPLISQFFPEQFRRIRGHEIAANAQELVIDKIRDVLRGYASACLPQMPGASTPAAVVAPESSQ